MGSYEGGVREEGGVAVEGSTDIGPLVGRITICWWWGGGGNCWDSLEGKGFDSMERDFVRGILRSEKSGGQSSLMFGTGKRWWS